MRLASPELFSWLEQNTTVVVPTRLQAAAAYRQFASEQLRRGRETWLRPPILSIRAFLFRCWQEARYRSLDVPLLLSPDQEHLLWKAVIEEDKPDLFDSSAAASLAANAARTLAEWQIPDNTPDWPERGDARQFRRWRTQFRERCRSRNWITLADLWSHLPGWIERKLCAREPLVFVLDRIVPPALRDLQRALGALASFRHFSEAREPRIRPGKGFDHLEAELDFAARWARGLFEAHPGSSIAICIPNAASLSGEIDRAFRDVFYPGSCRALIEPRLEQLAETPAYNLLAPASLRNEPIVAGALLLLQVARDRIETGIAGAILRSPWLKGAPEERNQRAAADTQLRRLRELDVSLDDLVCAASARAPQLAKILSSVRGLIEQSQPNRSFAGWSEFIGDLLGSLGWPSGKDLSGGEQRALEAWKEALSNLGSLSLVCPDVPFETALEELGNLLDAPFERENGLLAPVQILPPSLAAGLEFDAALVAGLGEDSWPPPHTSNPFLPLALQRKHEIPGSSQSLLRRERDAQLAKLFTFAPDVFATWSGRLSSAVVGFVSSKTPAPEFVWKNKATWESYKPAILDELEDSRGPAYIAGETARGGTGIIKSQSLCPFRAFAEYRLGSQSPEEGCLGYDARDRGGHLHSVLEFVWKKLGNSQRLKALSLPELESLVEEAAREAVRHVHPSPFGKIVHAVELARLKAVTLDWLKLERERLIPFTVETVEEDRTIEIAGLRLRLRLDRMDRLPNGGLVLIDYKSGEQKRSKLECPRPDEPQLLVYAAGIGPQVEGILFAQLKQRDVRPHGFTRQKHFRNIRTVDALETAWSDKAREWTEEVEQLAAQFQAGFAALDPKKGACAYCAQVAFCRIHEREAAEGAEEE
ncbi:MAG TPA: PD-(D/E)XK nuclease family protein [Bryobacteraceae bacterium]|jgi:probable DNA repair protein|nr:PD-(D/E)XK nuclease family protein [Bryobacteraceae bacterium]